MRRILSTLAIGLVALCAVGAAVGYFWYDRATRIDRSTPTVVVFQYVNAYFEEREPGRAELFECDGRRAAAALDPVLQDVREREKRFNIRIRVTASSFSTSAEGARADVKTSLLIDVPEADGGISRSRQRWVFELEDDNGWRVCDARRES